MKYRYKGNICLTIFIHTAHTKLQKQTCSVSCVEFVCSFGLKMISSKKHLSIALREHIQGELQEQRKKQQQIENRFCIHDNQITCLSASIISCII